MKPSVFAKRKYLLTEVLAAVLILVTVAGCIFYGKTSYSKMVSDIDERLDARIKKYDLYRKEYSASILVDPNNVDTARVMDLIYAIEDGGSFVNSGFDTYQINYLCYASDETGTTYELNTEVAEWLASMESLDTEGLAMLWKDSDGDLYGMVNGRTMVFPTEYCYSVSPGSPYESGQNYVTGINLRSNANRDMLSLAQELYTQDEKKGWAGEYRYQIAELADTDVYGDNYLFLTDCSKEKDEWKKKTVTVSLAAVLLDVILAGTVFFFEMKKNKQFVSGAKTENSPDPSEETERYEETGPSLGIPKDIAKQLINYVDDAERSTGPSGYLDSIRNTIEENTEK